jgi:HRAS-like suppressor 3
LISIRCKRGPVPYFHYGIDLGDGTVVHLASNEETQQMSVQRVSMEQFANGGEANGGELIIESVEDPLADDIVVARAIEAIGTEGYHLVIGNCEHFARELKTGRRESVQVDMYVSSVLRTAFTGMANVASRHVVAKSLTLLSHSKALLSVGALVPTVLGETARCSAYAAARKFSVSHQIAERSSRSVGHAATAVGGFVVGGPMGSLGALAISVAADRVTDSIQRKLRS